MAIVNGIDLSKYTWDQLNSDAGTAGETNGNVTSNLLGTGMQQYTNYLSKPKNVRWSDWDPGANVETLYNLSDPNAPAGYNTQLYRNPDGTIGSRYYEQKDTFLKDMAAMAAAATGIYGGINALAGAGLAGGGAGAAGTAASGGEMSLADAMGTYAPNFGAEVSAAGMGAESLPALETLGVDSAGGLAYGGANSGVGGLTSAQNLGKLLSAGSSLASGAGGATTGSALGHSLAGVGTGNNFFSQQQPQSVNVMPTFGATPVDQSGYTAELGNSQNIKQLAQALMANKGNING